MLTEYTRVMLITDKYTAEGASRGMIGYVIEVYPGGKYEVEFSDAMSGITQAQIVVDEQDVVPKGT